MGRAYSLDLRERVLKDCDDGMSNEDAARKYSVSIAWVDSLRKRHRETGGIAPKIYRRGQALKLAPYENEVRQLIAEHPDATLEELHAKLPDEVQVTVPTLHNFLKHLKITWKKTLHAAAEQHRDDVVEQREEWKKIQDFFVLEKFVFLDAALAGCNSAVATWTKTNMTPTHGRANIGKRVIDFVPHGHGKTTFLSALQHDNVKWHSCSITC